MASIHLTIEATEKIQKKKIYFVNIFILLGHAATQITTAAFLILHRFENDFIYFTLKDNTFTFELEIIFCYAIVIQFIPSTLNKKERTEL